MVPDPEENAASAGDSKWRHDTQDSRSTAYIV